MQIEIVPNWKAALRLKYLSIKLDKKHEMKKVKLIRMGATLSNFGLIVFNIEPEDKSITKIPVIFLKMGKCTDIRMSFLFKNLLTFLW